MGLLNLVLIAVGIVLVVLGYARARGPWARYQALREQEANVARYEAWRGGRRDRSPSGASVAMEMFRRQAQLGAAVAVVGAVVAIAGFFIR